MVDKNSRKAQVQYKTAFNKQVGLEPRFATDNYDFVERPLLMTSAADRMAHKRNSKLLTGRTEPYQVFGMSREYEKIGQDGFRTTILIIRMTTVPEERFELKRTSNPRKSKVVSPGSKMLTERKDNSYVVEIVTGHKNRPTGTYYTPWWYGYGAQHDTVEPAAHISHYFLKAHYIRL